jgi:hypothetical protein
MHIKLTLEKVWGRRGTFEWDSESGELGGDFAKDVAVAVNEAVTLGVAGWGPQFCLDYPIKDPLHTPAEMAVVLTQSSFILPAELLAVYPKPPPIDISDDPTIDY